MNDFGIDITGYVGVAKLKPGFSWPKNVKVEDREFKIESGSGCRSEVGTGRKVSGIWIKDKLLSEVLSSDDFEYLISPSGKRVNRLPEPELDVEPVKLAAEVAPGLPSKEELAAKKVRRKRG